MGTFRDILQETRDTIYDIKQDTHNSKLDRIHYSCQLWNLDQLLKFTDRINSLCKRKHNKQR